MTWLRGRNRHRPPSLTRAGTVAGSLDSGEGFAPVGSGTWGSTENRNCYLHLPGLFGRLLIRARKAALMLSSARPLSSYSRSSLACILYLAEHQAALPG